MLDIQKVDHIGIRVADALTSTRFYERLGFALISDVGFEEGHPIIMRHGGSGVTVNLLGPARDATGENVLMDVDSKYAGYTHIALRIGSLEETRAFLDRESIEITGSFEFGDMRAVFIRDPDRNVIELDEFRGDETRKGHDGGQEASA